MEIDFERLGNIVGEFQGKTAVVEGKNDAKALNALGIKDVIPINGRPLIKLIPLLENKEVVILSDFDKEGRKIAARLMRLLQHYRIMLNIRLRKEFMSFRINRIEDMINLAPEMDARGINIKEGDSYGKTCTNFNKICNKGRY